MRSTSRRGPAGRWMPRSEQAPHEHQHPVRHADHRRRSARRGGAQHRAQHHYFRAREEPSRHAAFQSHPGSFWSAVYYVDDGGIDADPSRGGELEFMDPRGPGPAMYAPQLAYGSAGLSVGANETVRPRTGRMVMFPAWLLHQVRPY